MQGIESLDNFKKFVSSLGGLGRFEDTYIVHAAEGETVVPMEVLDRNPLLKKRLFQSMVDMGIEPGRYIVGHELNSKNPVTGQPEFFLKKIVSQIRKALPGDSEKYLGTIVGLATGNPLLGALAGGVGSGMQGALTGGLTGFQSPGITGLGGGFGRNTVPFGNIFGGKTGPVELGDLFSKEGAGRFFFGEGDKGGLFGKFDFTKDTAGTGAGQILDEKGRDNLITEIRSDIANKNLSAATEKIDLLGSINELGDVGGATKSVLEGLSIGDAAKLYGLTTAGIGVLLALTEEDQEDTLREKRERTNEIYENILNMRGDRPTILGRAQGGVMDLRQGGESMGPGTGTSDDIPAMLSDGEFVMTAKAVRGAGGGDRREGAKRMYQMMDNLEARA